MNDPNPTKTTDHTITLQNLTPSTKYHFRVTAYSLPEVTGYSKDFTFSTLAPKVKAEVANVGNDKFDVRWYTPQKTSSIVEYTDVKTGSIKQIEDLTLVQSHSTTVDSLTPDSMYKVRVYGYDQDNNVSQDDTVYVHTTKDVTPPVISSFKIDNALLPGNANRLQTVVSWTTDKPSDSTVYYEEGVGTGDTLSSSVTQSGSVTGHILIIPSLKISTVYRIKVASKDAAGNVGQSPVKTILTPQSTENVIDVIVKNLQASFGFLKKLNQ